MNFLTNQYLKHIFPLLIAIPLVIHMIEFIIFALFPNYFVYVHLIDLNGL